LVLIFAGEALSVYAELLGAHRFVVGQHAFLGIFLRMFGLIAVAGGLLIAGYLLGYLSYKNIWIVSAFSLCSILIVEPFISWWIFHQLPTRGAFVGLLLGLVGLLFAIFDEEPLRWK
jgi:drug/metabolite transporter (DMT)-like permease